MHAVPTHHPRALCAFSLCLVFALTACYPRTVTDEEKAQSFAPYTKLTVNGVPIGDYIHERSVWLMAGTEITQTSLNPKTGIFGIDGHAIPGPPFRKPTGRWPQDRQLEALRYDVGNGSGIKISEDGYILTAAHVVLGYPGTPYVINHNSAEHAVIIFADEHADIAILRTRLKAQPYVPLAPASEASVDRSVIALGYSPGADGRYSPRPYAGRILEIPPHSPDAHWFTISSDAPVRPGDSGGPLILTDGRLIGVACAGVFGFPGKFSNFSEFVYFDPEKIQQVIDQDRKRVL